MFERRVLIGDGYYSRQIIAMGLGSQLLRRAKKSAGKPQRPEALWHLLFGMPRIDTGKSYVLPTERRDVFRQFIRNIAALLAGGSSPG